MSLAAATARARIAARADLHAFIALTEEDGPGPIVAVKDMIDVAGTVTTCGTRLPRAPAARDAAVVAHIRRAGGVIIGKTNLQPWAFGITSENRSWGDVRHPRDPGHFPGGSSGGSAVAVAAGLCDWALGTDTGGSVRIPAALCGTVGYKPSLGAISTEGVVALAPTLDTVGIFAPDVATTVTAFAMCLGRPATPQPAGAGPLRLAVPAGWVDDLDDAVHAVWNPVSAGIPLLDFPDRNALARTAMTILLAEAADVHRDTLARHPEAFEPEVQAALQRGLAIGAAERAAALAARRAAIAMVRAAMEGYDALLLPSTGRIAPRRGDPVRDKDLTRYTLPFNLTGQPAISVPAPVAEWPVGLQLVGRPGADDALLAAAASFERWLGRGPSGVSRSPPVAV